MSSLTISDKPSVVLSTQVSFGSEARSKFRLSISGHSDDDSGGQRTPLRAGTTVSGYYSHPPCDQSIHTDLTELAEHTEHTEHIGHTKYTEHTEYTGHYDCKDTEAD